MYEQKPCGSTSDLLAEAIGRYSAYGYCLRQLDCIDIASKDALEDLKRKVLNHYMDALDDYQSITNGLALDMADENQTPEKHEI